MMRGRPPARNQQQAQSLLRDACTKSGMSIRSLALRAGLRSHAALSRFLAGRQTLTPELVLRLAAILGIEGRAHERLVSGLVPDAVRSSLATSRPTLPKAQPDPQSPSVEAEGPLRDVRFFFHPKMPLLYELLKVLGPVTARQLVQALHPALGCSLEVAMECLAALRDVGLVREASGRWLVRDAQQDIVIPSKYSTEVGKKIIRDTIGMQERYIDLDSHSRIMRSIVLTARTPEAGNPMLAVVPNILSFQDDLLAQQQPDDDTVINVFVAATRVGGRPKTLATPAKLK